MAWPEYSRRSGALAAINRPEGDMVISKERTFLVDIS